MMFAHKLREYYGILGQDPKRGGCFLEVIDREDESGVLEVFRADSDGGLVVTVTGREAPVELVEWAIAAARSRLGAGAEA